MSGGDVDERSCRSAIVGWAAVAAIVAGYDAWALRGNRMTLSGAFWRARRHRQARYAAIGVWGALTWHLMTGDDPWRRKFMVIVDDRRNRRSDHQFPEMLVAIEQPA